MSRVCITNLQLIITERCNLNCAHCLRGECSDRVMSNEVIEAILSQVDCIHNLSISGGEPTLALDRLEYIFNYIVKKGILVGEVTITINGTVWSDKFINLLGYIEDYIRIYSDKSVAPFAQVEVSRDRFHKAEIERLGLGEIFNENASRYQENFHFYGFREDEQYVYSEGRAVNLLKPMTIELMLPPILYTYANKVGPFTFFDKNNGVLHIGPYIVVNTDGIVTSECNASFEHQRTLYNCGNILEETLPDIVKRKGRELRPRRWKKEGDKYVV